MERSNSARHSRSNSYNLNNFPSNSMPAERHPSLSTAPITSADLHQQTYDMQRQQHMQHPPEVLTRYTLTRPSFPLSPSPQMIPSLGQGPTSPLVLSLRPAGQFSPPLQGVTPTHSRGPSAQFSPPQVVTTTNSKGPAGQFSPALHSSGNPPMSAIPPMPTRQLNYGQFAPVPNFPASIQDPNRGPLSSFFAPLPQHAQQQQIPQQNPHDPVQAPQNQYTQQNSSKRSTRGSPRRPAQQAFMRGGRSNEKQTNNQI